MDQQKLQEQNLKLKGEVYDLNENMMAQNRAIMAICEKLNISVAEGVNIDELLAKLDELMEGDKE